MSTMRTPRALVAATVFGALIATSCGVIADENAAVAQGTPVPASVVNALATDGSFTAVVGLQASENESVLPGTGARDALNFAIRTQTIVNEAERWGLTVDAESAATAQALAQANVVVEDMSPEAENVIRRFIAASTVLTERFSQIVQPTEEDLVLLYVGSESLWERTCLTALTAPTPLAEDIEERLEAGEDYASIAATAEEIQVAADPETGCLNSNDLPPELLDPIAESAIGVASGPVQISAQGQDISVWYEISERQTVGFEEATPALVEMATQLGAQPIDTWITIVMANTVEVNPRYGSGVEIVADAQGAVSAEVARPDAPQPFLATLPELVPPAPEG